MQQAVDTDFEEDVVHEFTNWICEGTKCPHDKGIGQRHRFGKAPKVLGVQVVRWNATGKLGHHVHASETLQVDSQQYSLRSVVCHAGQATWSGHYYAFARYEVHGEDVWWLHNDALRRCAHPSEATSLSASTCPGRTYMPFY